MSTKDLARLERIKYEKIFKHKNYGAHSQGRKVISHLIAKVKKKEAEPTIVGDFGCARGPTFPALVEAGFVVYPIDHIDVLDSRWRTHPLVCKLRIANLWEDDLPRVDYGVCTDVMEHIPEEVVLATIKNIRAAVRHGVIWTVAHGPDAWGRVISDTLHMTQKLEPWWTARFKQVWDTVEVISTYKINTTYWTE